MKSKHTNTLSNVSSGFRRFGGICLAMGAVFAITSICAVAQEREERPSDRPIPTKPFRIMGNIYYVGQTDNSLPGTDDAAYLIATSEGHFLLDSGEEATVPQIRDNIQRLGFQLEDVKFILHSHAHADHVAGDALLKEILSRAQLAVMEGDADVVSSGGKTDFDSSRSKFKPAKVDRVLRDGEKIQLGGTTLVARKTAGHTKGCTTWTTVVEENGSKYNVAFVGGVRYSPRTSLVNNPRYPNIAEDFKQAFRVLRSLQVDVFLSSHGNFFGLVDKFRRLERGETPNPFIDPTGYKAYVDQTESAFLKGLEERR